MSPLYILTKQLSNRPMVVFIILSAVVFVCALHFFYRWSAMQRLKEFRDVMRAVLLGDRSRIKSTYENTFLAPFVEDLSRTLNELKRKELEGGSPSVESSFWNSRKLRQEVQKLFNGSSICVIANREPFVHVNQGKQIKILLPASGLVTAMEPILRACSGLWIGHGSGNADRATADKNGRLLVPPGKPEYVLKRVWLTDKEETGYYYGFANEGLWPLCHIAHTRPIFRLEDWIHYQNVNHKFARAFFDEMKGQQPVALIQDYHFALLPEMLRKHRPDALLSLFWHIPWPNPESFQICPWRKELLLGMLGADLIGFHTQFHCNNFLDSVDRFLEARIDRENFSVTVQGHTCFVKPFPISIEWPSKFDVPAEKIPTIRSEVLNELNLPQDSIVALGVDRLDYTKGIAERIRGVRKLLELHPQLIGKFVFIQIAAPSRTRISRYQQLETEVTELAEEVNSQFRRKGYKPILFKLEHHDAKSLYRYYRTANLCLVTSLHDGMNLVAKEYVASRSDSDGVLILSTFTGAARQMKDALVVNPYDTEDIQQALYRGICMAEEERGERMTRLRSGVAIHNVYHWAASYLQEMRIIADQQISRNLGRTAI